MEKLVNREDVFDFKMKDIAMLFGITLNDDADERSQAILVLAPVLALLRDMVLKQKSVPDSLWDIFVSLAHVVEDFTYPEIDGSSE